MSAAFVYSFPAIRGIQATREFYVAMFPMNLIPKLLLFDEQELRLQPEYRAQRVLNKARIPVIRDYLLDNPTEYVFSALTVSIDGDVGFVPASDDPQSYNIGTLTVPMSARLVVNDGQHRRAAIGAALRERPELGEEHIACVFFVDTGLGRCQQMFADLNRHAVRPTRSISILYDHRDPLARMVRQLVSTVPVFSGLTEMDKSTIPNRSVKLFTLSGVFRATRELLGERAGADPEEDLRLAHAFWGEVAKHMEQWEQVRNGEIPAADLRRDYIHAHTVGLVAIGRAGRALLDQRPKEWRSRLAPIGNVDWHRRNALQWEGRALIGGRVSISRNNITLLANEVKHILGLTLSEEEEAAEQAFLAARGQRI
jgi:DNA sulfur modification protein DndB